MTRYVINCPAEVFNGAPGLQPSLILHTKLGTYSIPVHAVTAEDDAPTDGFKVADMVDMSMHRICGLIDSQMRRIKQLELDLAAAARAGYVPPEPAPAKVAAEKPVQGYKPLDHGPREGV